jgi:hypothetical protein
MSEWSYCEAAGGVPSRPVRPSPVNPAGRVGDPRGALLQTWYGFVVERRSAARIHTPQFGAATFGLVN